jgi:hypothetical protein
VKDAVPSNRRVPRGHPEEHRRFSEISFPSTVAFDVVERRPGRLTSAFAAPECRRPFPQIAAEVDRAELTPAAAKRLVGLVSGAWATFDEIAVASPAELRKGPRGGGRDRDKLIDHVIGADAVFARNLGIRLKKPAIGDSAAIEELRQAITTAVGGSSDGSPVVPTAGPRATRSAESPGTSSNMLGRCRTGRRARHRSHQEDLMPSLENMPEGTTLLFWVLSQALPGVQPRTAPCE